MNADSNTTQITLPTDEQVERAALAMAAAEGAFGPNRMLVEEFGKEARKALAILLNKDRILGYR